MDTKSAMSVESLATADPTFVAPSDSLRRVTELMWSTSAGSVLVGTPRHVLGIVSERDVVSALGRGADPDTVRAAAVMSTQIVTVRPDATVQDAAVDMVDLGIRHLPMVDDRGRVEAIVSVGDVLRPLLEDARRHRPIRSR